MKVILDTDIGTDVDDCLALALLLKSPEVDLLGITCVYADVQLRAKMTLKLLQLYGTDIPVYAGASTPLMQIGEIYWGGHEGVGLLTPEDDALTPEPDFAPDYLIEMIRANPGEIHLIAIGPLTNVAMALQKAPDIAEKVASLVIMGGVVRGNDGLSLPYAEHNIICDPQAAHIVFSSGAPIILTPLNITVQTHIDQHGLERIASGGTPFHAAVADQLARYPRIIAFGQTAMHDPLAIATLLQPDLVTTQPVDVNIELESKIAVGATHFKSSPGSNFKLVDSVRADDFVEFYLTRVET